MSRSTQFVGHTDEVLHFLMSCQKIKKINEVEGMFGESVADLYSYVDLEGEIWDEFIQEEIWDSGPMIFTGIKSSSGKIKGWIVEKSTNGFNVNYDHGIIYF